MTRTTLLTELTLELISRDEKKMKFVNPQKPQVSSFISSAFPFIYQDMSGVQDRRMLLASFRSVLHGPVGVSPSFLQMKAYPPVAVSHRSEQILQVLRIKSNRNLKPKKNLADGLG